MIKKFTRPFMPLVLLLSSKTFCNQMPSEDMPKCSEVNLAEQSMPNPEDALRNCCKEKCKKCKCKKFCKLLVSKNLKTESLSVVKNATVGGNLAVTGSTTLNGSYPVLNQYEQVYSLKGLLAAQSNTSVTLALGTALSNNPTVYSVTTSISNGGVTISSGEGFTVSSLSGSGYYYSEFLGETDYANTILNFSVTVTFDTPFTKTPSIDISLNSDTALNSFLSSLNGIIHLNYMFLNYLDILVSEPSSTGFTLNIVLGAFSRHIDLSTTEPTYAFADLGAFATALLQNATLGFTVDGIITPSAPVCPACPTIKPCCR